MTHYWILLNRPPCLVPIRPGKATHSTSHRGDIRELLPHLACVELYHCTTNVLSLLLCYDPCS